MQYSVGNKAITWLDKPKSTDMMSGILSFFSFLNDELLPHIFLAWHVIAVTCGELMNVLLDQM